METNSFILHHSCLVRAQVVQEQNIEEEEGRGCVREDETAMLCAIVICHGIHSDSHSQRRTRKIRKYQDHEMHQHYFRLALMISAPFSATA